MRIKLMKINREHVIGAVCLAIGATVLILTRNFPSGQGYVQLTGPAFFPNVLAFILLITGVIEIVVGVVQRATLPVLSFTVIGETLRDRQVQSVLIALGLMVLYVVFMKVIGFFTTSFIFLSGMMWRMGVKIVRNIIYTVVLLVVLYLVFARLFFVNLPQGLIG